MPRSIDKRWLVVMFLKGLQGSAEEAVEYRVAPSPAGGATPGPHRRTVRWQTLVRECEQVRNSVASLIDAARTGRPRDGIDLEATIEKLAKKTLPEGGLSQLFPDAASGHPWFDVCPPFVADLPWEAFPETFRVCDNPGCSRRGKPMQPEDATLASPGYCACGHAFRFVQRKLAFGRHVTHLVHNAEATLPAQGRLFLIIANPTGDLFNQETDGGRYCETHIVELKDLLENAGYEVALLCGPSATAVAVLEYLRNPALVGVYYFGHGYLDDGGDEGCLVLHNRSPLFASEIEEVRSSCPFVFLNACHGAAVGKNWGFDKPLRSVAHAFAAGSTSKVVIAPIWPIVGRLAATMAINFFRRAVRGVRLPLALRAARRISHRRYEADEPDFCWAAYRYFGDLDRRLPVPLKPASPEVSLTDRVFDSGGQLRLDAFSFPLDEMLLRSAKRRLLHNRRLASYSDLLAGLIRRGELTRFSLRQMGRDPDELYDQLVAAHEGDAKDARPDPDVMSASDLDRWMIRRRDELDEEAFATLLRADALARQKAPNRLICELDLLEAFVVGDGWDKNPFVVLPTAEQVRQVVRDASRRRHLDDDGCLNLADLNTAARKVIQRAHALAQLRGICPIASRLMLIAFVIDEHSYAARLCEQHGVHTTSLSAILLELPGGESPTTFGLGDYAGSRIITPTIGRARELAGDGAVIDEPKLFRAFCQSAPEDFRQLLRALPKPWQLDLDALLCEDTDPKAAAAMDVDPALDAMLGSDFGGNESSKPVAISRERFDDDGRLIIALAANWARLQRSASVRSPHLFAALVGDGSGPLATMLKQGGMNPEVAKILILGMISLATSDQPDAHAIQLGPNVVKVLTHAIEIADKRSRKQATAGDIIQALFSDGGGAVGEQLRAWGVDTSPWWLVGGNRRYEGNGRKPRPT